MVGLPCEVTVVTVGELQGGHPCPGHTGPAYDGHDVCALVLKEDGRSDGTPSDAV